MGGEGLNPDASGQARRSEPATDAGASDARCGAAAGDAASEAHDGTDAQLALALDEKETLRRAAVRAALVAEAKSGCGAARNGLLQAQTFPRPAAWRASARRPIPAGPAQLSLKGARCV